LNVPGGVLPDLPIEHDLEQIRPAQLQVVPQQLLKD
jgi:hypothetical protein